MGGIPGNKKCEKREKQPDFTAFINNLSLVLTCIILSIENMSSRFHTIKRFPCDLAILIPINQGPLVHELLDVIPVPASQSLEQNRPVFFTISYKKPNFFKKRYS